MEEIVKREKKSFINIVLITLGLVFLVDFLIGLLDNFKERFPYITTLVSIVLVVLACGFILLRYMSKLSYFVNEDYLVFSRIVGKRYFEILRIGLEEIDSLELYDDGEKEKIHFRFNLAEKLSYLLSYTREGRKIRLIFSPSNKFIGTLNKYMEEI